MNDVTPTDDRSGSDAPGLPFLLDGQSDQGPPVVAWIERTLEGIEECTLAPRDVDTDDERMTQWLTAREGSFVSLAEMC